MNVNIKLDNIKDTITDPVSLCVFIDPYSLPCGHTFSKETLDSIIATAEQHKRQTSCPSCRAEFLKSTIKPNYALRDSIPTTLRLIAHLEEQLKSQQINQPVQSINTFNSTSTSTSTSTSNSVSNSVFNSSSDSSHNISALSLHVINNPNNNRFQMIEISSPDGDSAVPNDLIICIDVSGSMQESVKRKGENGVDIDDGFSTLDIVKHAALALIAGMRETDRVGIVTFSTAASMVSYLLAMTESNKKQLSDEIKKLHPGGITNLWAGIETSLNILKDAPVFVAQRSRRSTICLLTDGEPSAECAPGVGYKNALKRYRSKNPTFSCSINTIGFGYNLDSILLDEISKEINGAYCFVPDGTLVGTVFTHLGANMAVTLGSNATLKLTFDSIDDISHVINNTITDIDTCYQWSKNNKELSIHIGDICYGQNRSICIPSSKLTNVSLVYTNNLTHKNETVELSVTTDDLNVDPNNRYCRLTAQLLRQMLVSSVRKAMNIALCNDLHGAISLLNDTHRNIMTLGINGGTECMDIIKDMGGQIMEAFSRRDWYDKWGKHYLPSLVNAHINQQCNNFKDHGVQHFGGNLFKIIRDTIDDLFNTLPIPQPSRIVPYVNRNINNATTSMSSYNSSYDPCFRADGLVKMYDGSQKRIDRIMPGDKVAPYKKCSDEFYEVLYVIKSKCQDNYTRFVNYQGLYLTPTHPILVTSTIGSYEYAEWCRPIDIIQLSEKQYCEYVYNFILKSGHIMNVSGVDCVTLAHGFDDNDRIKHPFYGTHNIIDSIYAATGASSGTILLDCNPTIRDEITGWVKNFDSAKIHIQKTEI